jgi:hypothetical protein
MESAAMNTIVVADGDIPGAAECCERRDIIRARSNGSGVAGQLHPWDEGESAHHDKADYRH